MRGDTQTDIRYVCDPPLARVRIIGELDLTTDDQLHETFTYLHGTGCIRLQLDLEAVTFIDAHSLGVLHAEQRRLRAIGGTLDVVAASSRVVRVTELARYDELRPTIPSQRAAGDPTWVPADHDHRTPRAGL